MIRALFRNLYPVLSLFALLHFIVLAGLLGYGFASGRFDRNKLAGVVQVLKGAQVLTPEPDRETVEQMTVGSQDSRATSEAKIKEVIEAQDIARLKQERAKADLQRMESLLNQRMLSLRLDIERYENRVAREEEQRRKKRERELSAGYQSTIATIEAMKPKNARDMLMQMSESDAVKILMKLDETARKDILESCKKQEETTWRDRMMQEMLKQPLLTAGTAP